MKTNNKYTLLFFTLGLACLALTPIFADVDFEVAPESRYVDETLYVDQPQVQYVETDTDGLYDSGTTYYNDGVGVDVGVGPIGVGVGVGATNYYRNNYYNRGYYNRGAYRNGYNRGAYNRGYERAGIYHGGGRR